LPEVTDHSFSNFVISYYADDVISTAKLSHEYEPLYTNRTARPAIYFQSKAALE